MECRKCHRETKSGVLTGIGLVCHPCVNTIREEMYMKKVEKTVKAPVVKAPPLPKWFNKKEGEKQREVIKAYMKTYKLTKKELENAAFNLLFSN